MAELALDEDKEFLLDSIINGFELIPADLPLSPAEMDNYSSSTKPEARDKVEQTLQEEIAEGNYIITPTRPTIVSTISAVPNAGSHELGLIHDCSMPGGKGVNSYVPSLHKFHFKQLMMLSSLLIKIITLLRLTYAMPTGQCPSTLLITLLLV